MKTYFYKQKDSSPISPTEAQGIKDESEKA